MLARASRWYVHLFPASASNDLKLIHDCFVVDLEWKVTYVGNARDAKFDQTLEEAMVGPVPVGVNRFILQTPPPNPAQIPNQDLIGVTVILLSCSYLNQKFVQIGYFVNNEYADPFEPENYPDPVDIAKLGRNILADEPRVTRFPIDWTGANPTVATMDGATVEEEAAAIAADGQDDGMDVEAMDEDDDEEEDEEEEDEEEDDSAEVDLEDEEEGEEEEEGEDEEAEGEEGEEGDEYDEEMRMNTSFEYPEGMEIINNDSNSIDIARMLAK